MKTHGSIQKFFRLYMPNFSEDDMILPLVLDEILPLPRKVSVESVSSGKVWKMEMTSNGGSDTVFLRDGWKKIVKGENLNAPTFLVFEFDGSRVFHFSMYDHVSMCKRMRSPVVKEADDGESEEADDEESEETDEEESTKLVEEESEEAEETDGEESTKLAEEESEETDDEESTKLVDEFPRRKERGGTSRRNRYLKTDSDQFKEYIDDKLNPSFPVHMDKNRTRIPSTLIKDYNLTFPELVNVRDKIGTLKKKISVWNNGSVFLNGVDSFVRRNDLKPNDKIVLELKMVDGHHGLVSEIKVHIIKD